MNKLSKLQKHILLMAYRRGRVSNADILIELYGFKPVSYGNLRFDREQIGMKRYLGASASVATSLTRLRHRCLLRRGPLNRGHLLTPQGVEAAKQLYSNTIKKESRVGNG